jgi:hypothetical protein
MRLATRVAGLVIALVGPVLGQSTSPWVRIADTTIGDATVKAASPGATYMTVVLRSASVYQNSNWWTGFVEKNRQAVLTIDVDGVISGVHVQDTRTGKAIELHKNKSLVDLGYAGLVFEHLPTTFNSLSVTFSINKTANDGLQGLINTLADISKATPSISPSQSAMGIVSGAKSIADFLFTKNLLVQKVVSPSPFASSAVTAPGRYLILAGDAATDYDNYLLPPSAGQKGLDWQNGVLMWNGSLISNLSYFVIDIGYAKVVFDSPENALSLATLKPWAALYQLARRQVDTVTTADGAPKIVDEIRSHLFDANTLLDADLDYIQSEKDSISTAVRSDIGKRLNDRLAALSQAAASGGLPLPPPPEPGAKPQVAPPSVVLAVPDHKNSSAILKELQKNDVDVIKKKQ